MGCMCLCLYVHACMCVCVCGHMCAGVDPENEEGGFHSKSNYNAHASAPEIFKGHTHFQHILVVCSSRIIILKRQEASEESCC